jgi:hypothetical protein
MTIKDVSAARRWFRRVLWLGIVVNIALAIPTILVPERMIELMRLPPVMPDLWTRFAALLLVLLSTFYMPAGIDLDRYRANAWLAVMSRLVGVTFFALQPRVYYQLGAIDLVFFVPEVILLTLALRAPSPSSPAWASRGVA